MSRIPVRFKRVAMAFNEAARVKPCGGSSSSGSEHYSADLSDLVNSFMEREYKVNKREKERKEFGNNQENENGSSSSTTKLEYSENNYFSYSEAKDWLQNIFRSSNGDDVRHSILEETEIACGIIKGRSKRGLMTFLREKGFDAGLCKSKWEKFGRHPSGEYEYVDVNVGGKRYIVEAFLAGEFEIARPTTQFAELIEVFPRVFVGRPEELKQIVRVMCNAIRESMKAIEMHVAPWRRNGYMQAKWFGHYKRTTNEIPTKKSDENIASAAKRSVGFDQAMAMAPGRVYNCRDDFAGRVGFKVGYLSGRVGFKVGYLSAAFNEMA